MNPDGTNPATNTGASGTVVPPALDFTSSDTTNLSMADSLASAADNLTSAGMAAKEPDSGSIDMGQIGASDPSAQMERPDEPLIPAAPVPGSIGSVTSGPAVSDSAVGNGVADASGYGAAGFGASGNTATGFDAASTGAATSFGTTGVGASTGFGAPAGASASTGAATGYGTSASTTGFGVASGVTGASTGATGYGATSGVSGFSGGSTGSVDGMMNSSATASSSTGASEAVGATSSVAEPAPAEPYNPFSARMGNSATGNDSGATGGATGVGATGASSGGASFNPFGAKAAQTSSMNVPTGSQPATEKFSGKATGAKKANLLTVILGILAVVSLVMAIVFAVLWQQALSAEKVVLVPPASGGDVDQTMAMITCTKDLGADAVESMPGLVSHTVTATANFTNDQLGTIKMTNRYMFVDDASAEATRPVFDATVAADVNLGAELGVAAVEAAYEINGVTVNYNTSAEAEQLKSGYAGVFGLPASEDGSVDSSRAGIQGAYEADGFACTED